MIYGHGQSIVLYLGIMLSVGTVESALWVVTVVMTVTL